VQIGVLRSQNKEKLFKLKTGQSFDFNDYRIAVGPVGFDSENLKLSVFEKGKFIGSFNTLSGSTDLPAEFPFTFKLVAFVTPKLKRQWVDLTLTDTSGNVTEGTSEVNGPLQWGGLYFFNTQVALDPDGVPYAGIQVVRDPGRWLVFSGMVIVAVGAFMATFRRWYGFR
jgi:cytochrome c biogenesis protein ResB